jgi:hypothetical protein
MVGEPRSTLAGANHHFRAHVPSAPQLERDVLDRGRAITRGERNLDYGPPERNLAAIAAVWNATVLRECPFDLTARDVSLMLAGLKLVRASARINDDDLPDLAGYVLLADEATKEAD